MVPPLYESEPSGPSNAATSRDGADGAVFSVVVRAAAHRIVVTREKRRSGVLRPRARMARHMATTQE